MNPPKKIKYLFSIVAYQAPEYFDRCVKNLSWTKEHPDIGIVVIDNSPDNSIEQLIPTYDLELGYLKTNQNLGFGSGHNLAYKIAAPLAPEFMLILNPDLVIDGEDFDSMTQMADDHTTTAIIGPKIFNEAELQEASVLTDPPGIAYLLEFSRQIIFGGRNSELGLKKLKNKESVKGVTGACMLLRLELIEKPLIFDPEFHMYYEDLDLCTRTRLNGWNILFDPNANVLHTKNASSQEIPDNERWKTEMMYRSSLRYFRKNKKPMDIWFLETSLKIALKLRIKLNKEREWAEKLYLDLFPPKNE